MEKRKRKTLLNMLCLVFIVVMNSILVFANQNEIVNIVAELVLDGYTFHQSGQGWIIKFTDRPNFYILTPSHVIHGAQNFSFYCKEKKITELKLIGDSPTYDLALLEIQPQSLIDCELNPLITINNIITDKKIEQLTLADFKFDTKYYKSDFRNWISSYSNKKYDSSGFRFIEKETENFIAGIMIDDNLRFKTNSYSSKNRDLSPYNSDIFSDFGIKPGLSGGAYTMAQQSLPLGMVTKTRINDKKALIIPTQELIPISFLLLNGGDPWTKNKPYAAIDFKYEVENLNNQKYLNRTRFMTYKSAQHDITFTELCSQAKFKLSSSWEWLPSGGSWIASTTDSLAGGSWVNSTDDSFHLKSNFTGVPNIQAEVTTSENSSQIYLVWSYYKDLKPCNTEGIKLSDGRILLGLWDTTQDLSIRIDDLNTLLSFVLEKEYDFINYINRFGIFKNQNDKNFDVFCRTKIMGPKKTLKNQIEYSLGGQKNWIVENKKLKFAYEVEKKWYQEDEEKSNENVIRLSEYSFFQCSDLVGKDGNKRSNYKLEFKLVSTQLTANIFFIPNGIVGSFYYPNKDSNSEEHTLIDDFLSNTDSNIKDGNFWTHTIKTKMGVKALITLNPNTELLEITFLEIPDQLNSYLTPILLDNSSIMTNSPLIWLLKYKLNLHSSEVE